MSDSAPESQARNEDLLEAHSIKYTLGIRLARLSSGNWAVFWGGENGLEQVTVGEVLDLGQLAAWAEQELEARRSWQARYLARLATGEFGPEPTATVVATKNLEDMGL